MNSCEACQELISRLVDGEISREEHEALTEHLKSCSSCNAMFAVFHDLSDILSEEPEELPEGLHENIMAGVRRSAIIKKNRRMRKFGLRMALTAAACAVLVLAGTAGFGRRSLKDTTSVRTEETVQQFRQEAEASPTAAQPAAPAPTAAQVPTPAQTPRTYTETPPPQTPVWPQAPACSAPDPYLAAQETGRTDDRQNANIPAQPDTTIDLPSWTADESPVYEQTPATNAAEYAAPVQMPPAENPETDEDTAEILPNLFSLFSAPAAPEAADEAEELPVNEAPAELAESKAAAVPNAFALAGEETQPEENAEAVPNRAEAPTERDYSIRGTEARLRLLLLLGGEQANLPELQPSRLIRVRLLPDDDFGEAEKLEIRIYGDFIFFTYYPHSGEVSSFRADCAVETLDAWLGALPTAAETPAPTADPFSEGEAAA